jgi:general secretion pathway protein K
MRRHRDESGVALLVVLLAITLLTVVVVEFTYSAQIETHLAFSGRNLLQATYLARSGINVAETLLQYDQAISKLERPTIDSTIDTDLDPWAKPLPPYPIGDGTVAVRVRDEARAINLNDLLGSSPTDQAALELIGFKVFASRGVDRSVLHAILDWIDPDSEPYPSPPGAEGSFYLQQTPPVRIRNGPLLTMRELRLVRGVTPEILDRLEGYVTVVPRDTKGLHVNINTAPPEVLMALSDKMTWGMADRILETRGGAPFAPGSLDKMTDLREALNNGERITYGSKYFRIESVGTVNDVHRGIIATVERASGSSQTLAGVAAPQKITRVSWFPNAAPRSLTSQPPSDFLRALPPLGGSG